mmetsp:Transcript_41139/g.98529  ORF Transcript_41139/g.98529 Transcript_41139/m.98529 type:complete len:81 (+) Transcript_41139:770-1012(+)
MACRDILGTQGLENVDYELHGTGIQTESECESICTNKLWDCKAFEYNYKTGRCEIWVKQPRKVQSKPGFSCHVKVAQAVP